MTIIGETTVDFYGILHSWGDLVLITVKMPIAVLSVEELSWFADDQRFSEADPWSSPNAAQEWPAMPRAITVAELECGAYTVKPRNEKKKTMMMIML